MFRIQRCSYCGEQGHNITTCNHEDIHKFRQECFGNRIVFEYSIQSRNQPREKFMEWILGLSLTNPQIVLVFASRFCRVPSHIDFIQRCIKIADYVYAYSVEESKQITNPTNNGIVNLALTNREVLVGMAFNQRVDYLNRVVLYLEASRRNQNNLATKFKILTTLKEPKEKQQEEQEQEQEDQEHVECCICYESKSKEQYVDLNCGHQFCGECFITTLKTTSHPEAKCSLCRESVKSVVIYDTKLMGEMALLIE